MFFPQSVERITRSLGRMVDELEAHAVHQDDRAEVHITKRNEHDSHAVDARAEANRAREVAHKIRGLVG